MNVSAIQRVTVFAPATVANVACGFDVLGFALDAPGDELTLERTDTPGIELVSIEGDGGVLPRDPARNAASVAAADLLEHLKVPFGARMYLRKRMPSGSGLGSSAASAVAGVFAANALCGSPLTQRQMLPFAMNGEYAACGARIADNVAASLFGGFIAVRSYDPLDILSLPVPENLYAAVVYPHITILTKDARELLPKSVPMHTSTRQSGNLVGLISGLYTSDYALIGRSVQDYIAEPHRKLLIHGFDAIKQAAMQSGALGCSISGSGPSVFCLCEGSETAQRAGEAMRQAVLAHGMHVDLYVSKVNPTGPTLLSAE